ncbi:tyrosine-type recombinase/integrase [Prochlorococcus sp. MIT 1300]|uniref:tyrosine-type recombinase/integrase n=1 Tax=Prochlorococcus sp. MIT 1300 TaxID=3096218 RepID=UPI002A75D1CA|nr:tyrosine-type recombinase/integrase [Prochlorococcus sp. MIT 1300]
MPKQVEKDSWVIAVRELLKESLASTDQWFISQSRGQIRLEIRDNGKQSKVLPFAWTKKGGSQALPRILEIYKRYVQGKGKLTLAQCCEVTEVSSSKHEIAWNELIKDFKPFVPNASEKTWQKSYVPVLNRAAVLMQRTKGKPKDGEELMMKALEQWEQGSRSRQIARRSLKNFLQWGVLRGKLIAAYAPPAHIPETRKPKRIGYALTDLQILRLIEFEPDEKWRFAFQLCSVYGLRPEELRHLAIKEGPNGKELWCKYQKSKGGKRGDKTEPRRLHSLFLKDMDGNLVDWNLQVRIEADESLPPLGDEGDGGEALRTHLRRRPVWKALKKEAEHVGEVLVPYTFRHRYAKASHAAGFPVSNIAAAMGHTLEVHLESYARFIPDGTADLYAKRNAREKAA